MIQNINNQSMDCLKRIDIKHLSEAVGTTHHVTRSFIISTAANLGDLQYVAKRLMRKFTDGPSCKHQSELVKERMENDAV